MTSNINENYSKHTYSDWNIDYKNNNNIFRIDDVDDINVVNDINNEVFVRYEDVNDYNAKYEDNSDYRKAAVIHKLARSVARDYLHANGRLADLVDGVENAILKFTKQDPDTYFEHGSKYNGKNHAGIAFPVSVNINNTVAHDTKIIKCRDDRTFCLGDIVKVSIGVHVNGRIIDSCFTHIIGEKAGVSYDESMYAPLLEASADSMMSAIKMSGVDARLIEISEVIEEVITSYQINTNSLSIPISPVYNIGGHSMDVNVEHGKKMIFCSPNEKVQGNSKMEEGEIYAMGTYASTGIGNATHNTSEPDMNCTHFMINDSLADVATKKEIKHFRKTDFYKWSKTRKGLTFSSAWLYSDLRYNDYGILTSEPHIKKLDKAMELAIQSEQMLCYPPVEDEKSARVSHFQHTIRVGDRCVEIFSLGDDY